MKFNRRLSRRETLKKLGASATMLPVLSSELLSAQTGDIPQRLVCVTMSNGNDNNDFHAFHSGGSYTLSGLNPWKDKVTTIKGMGMKIMLDQDDEYSGHGSHPCALTGSHTGGFTASAKNASIDQMVADHIAQSVQLPRKLLNLGVRSERDGRNTSWRAAGQTNANETSSRSLFNNLFSSPIVPMQMLDEIAIKNASVLDYLGKELETFGRKMGTEDRIKIQAHLSSIRELETQLNVVAPVSCDIPEVDTSEYVPSRMDAMFRMMGTALRCDYTRAITMELYDNGGGNGNTFPWLNINSDYHEIAHAEIGTPQDKRDIEKWLFDQVAILVKDLDDSPEGGVTALDNTVILVGNDMNSGSNHWVGEINYALIGSAGGKLRTGNALNVGSRQPHNYLLTTLVNAMGISTNRVGDGYSGNLPQLLA